MKDPIKIYSITEKPIYESKLQGINEEVYQEFLVDMGGVAARDFILPILKKDKRLPRPFQQNTKFPILYSKTVSYKQMDDLPNVWVVSVQWSSVTSVQETIQNPSDRPALITTGTYKEQVDPDVDYNGKPLCTTAGEPINFSYQKSYSTFQIEKNYSEYPERFATVRDLVNEDEVSIYGVKFEPYTLFCSEVEISHLKWEGKYAFFTLTARIFVNTKKNKKDETVGWRIFKRNSGYHEKVITGWRVHHRQYNSGPLNSKTVAAFNQTVPTFKEAREVYETRRLFFGYTSVPIAWVDANLLITPVYTLAAIRLGSPGNYHYPSAPVLLGVEGKAFRERKAGDYEKAVEDLTYANLLPKITADNFVRLAPQIAYIQKMLARYKAGYFPGTGVIIGTTAPGEPKATTGITEEEWDEAVVEGVLYNLVKFNDYFPFDDQFVPSYLRSVTL
jgi:hypothetical protein